MVATIASPRQLPLIEFVESDDLFLQDEPDALWFDVLRKLDYRQFQPTAARYYEQLDHGPASPRHRNYVPERSAVGTGDDRYAGRKFGEFAFSRRVEQSIALQCSPGFLQAQLPQSTLVCWNESFHREAKLTSLLPYSGCCF